MTFRRGLENSQPITETPSRIWIICISCTLRSETTVCQRIFLCVYNVENFTEPGVLKIRPQIPAYVFRFLTVHVESQQKEMI